MTERLKLFDFGQKQLKSRLDMCLWPEQECLETAIRAHSVQNKEVLEQLCRKGHVVMPRVKLNAKKPPTFIFEEIGRNKATTFTGLCSEHDNILFKPIEACSINYQDPHHLFLLAYRAVLKEAHASRKTAIDIQVTFQEGVRKGLFPKDEPSPPGELAVDHMISAYLVEEIRKRFNAAYLDKDWTRVEHKLAVIESSPGVAVNSMFTTGIYSKATDAAAFVTLNIFPNRSTDKTIVVFSFLKENQPEAFQAFESIWSARGDYQQYELSKLILRKCENLVIAPALYDAFSDSQKKAIQCYFERNTGDNLYDTEDPNLFLFRPV